MIASRAAVLLPIATRKKFNRATRTPPRPEKIVPAGSASRFAHFADAARAGRHVRHRGRGPAGARKR